MSIELVKEYEQGRYTIAPAGQGGVYAESLPEDCQRIQWIYQLSPTEVASLSNLVRRKPDIELSALAGATDDLSWLLEFPGHRKFDLSLEDDGDAQGLKHLPESAVEVSIRGRCTMVDVSSLSHVRGLRSLWVTNSQKSMEALAGFACLEKLMVREARKLDASVFRNIPNLWSLDIKLGSLVNVDAIGDCAKLKYLELWMPKGLSDIQFVSRLSSLQYLFLEALGQVQSLPDFSRLNQLRRAWFQGLHRVSDLSPLADCPSLEDLCISTLRSLTVESFRPLSRVRSLRRLFVDTGSRKRDAAIEEMLGLKSDQLDKCDFDYH